LPRRGLVWMPWPVRHDILYNDTQQNGILNQDVLQNSI
jgi:hypothetical protein